MLYILNFQIFTQTIVQRITLSLRFCENEKTSYYTYDEGVIFRLTPTRVPFQFLIAFSC